VILTPIENRSLIGGSVSHNACSSAPERVLHGSGCKGDRPRRRPCKSQAPGVTSTAARALGPVAGGVGTPVPRGRVARTPRERDELGRAPAAHRKRRPDACGAPPSSRPPSPLSALCDLCAFGAGPPDGDGAASRPSGVPSRVSGRLALVASARAAVSRSPRGWAGGRGGGHVTGHRPRWPWPPRDLTRRPRRCGAVCVASRSVGSAGPR
jgi:hypothetical protein